MLEIKTILLILLIHWAGDFCLQTDGQAKRKSTELMPLAEHVTSYSLVWLIAAYCMLGNWDSAVIFASITWVAHYWTDFCTSRIGKPYWEKNDFHNGFVVIGFDQILHYIQLFITYNWLSN
jgi:hypothetical protein